MVLTPRMSVEQVTGTEKLKVTMRKKIKVLNIDR